VIRVLQVYSGVLRGHMGKGRRSPSDGWSAVGSCQRRRGGARERARDAQGPERWVGNQKCLPKPLTGHPPKKEKTGFPRGPPPWY